MFKKILILFLLSVFYFLDSSSASAADFYFVSPSEVREGENFSLDVMIGTQNFINAIEGEVRFDDNFLEFDSVLTGSSVIPLWIEQPQIVGRGIIRFSGIIPGGIGPVISSEFKIFTVVFRPRKTGQTEIKFANYKTYLHQQSAEETSNTAENIKINILQPSETMATVKDVLLLDFYPPEPFQIFVTKNKDFYDNKYVAIFSAQDKGTGTDHYEIKESFLGLKGAWNRGESPYQLLDQNLFSIIKVKAVDKVGRERIEKFVPPRVVYTLVIALVILAFAIIGLVYILLRGVIKKSKFGGI